MFGAMRSCPATLSRRASTAVFSARLLRTPLLPLTHSASAALSIPLQTSRLAKASFAGFHASARWQEAAAVEENGTASKGLATTFHELKTSGLVHPNIINTITQKMRLETMTDVQTRTINEALSGVDIIAQAKTGTGKTLGFLIPVIQRIVQNDPKLGEKTRGYKRARADDIRAIVISPTRELAEQIAVEAKKVTSDTGIIVQVAVGGTQKRAMLNQTQREGCHLLIGTPGRLFDIFSDPRSGIKAPRLNALVMDEADRLLDEGFTREIDDIKQHLPDPKVVERQNLMFSATIPRDVVTLVRKTLRPGFHFAKCVNEDEAPTHERVPQKFVSVNGFENIMPTLYEIVSDANKASLSGASRPFKAIVYFNSTAEVTLAASVFYKMMGPNKRSPILSDFPNIRAFEIHAKLSQQQRTRSADDFRNVRSGVLFSSDVTARGMDFPNVTHVIQIGLPRERDSYIHRLGRTARAGKEGEGWIILTPYEEREASRRLRDLPLVDATDELECATVDLTQPAEVPEKVGHILNQCLDAHKSVYPDQLDAAFRGLFGAYQWYGDKQALLDGANRLAEFGWGMPTPPNPPASLFSGGGRRGGGGGGGGRQSRGFGGDRKSSYGGEFSREFRGSNGFGGNAGGDRRGGGGGFGDRRGGGSFGDKRGGGSFGDRRGGGGFGDRRGGSGFGDRRGGGDRGGDRRGGGERKPREPRFDF